MQTQYNPRCSRRKQVAYPNLPFCTLCIKQADNQIQAKKQYSYVRTRDNRSSAIIVKVPRLLNGMRNCIENWFLGELILTMSQEPMETENQIEIVENPQYSIPSMFDEILCLL